MSEMIERAARAIYESRNGRGAMPWTQMDKNHMQPYLEDARVAIKAMREPTEAMSKAIARADWMGTKDLSWADGWRIMIHEALK